VFKHQERGGALQLETRREKAIKNIRLRSVIRPFVSHGIKSDCKRSNDPVFRNPGIFINAKMLDMFSVYGEYDPRLRSE